MKCLFRAGRTWWTRWGFALLLALLAGLETASAQDALGEAALRAPWERQLLVLQSLSNTVLGTTGADRRAALTDHLTAVQVSVGEYETQVDEVIDRLIGDPQYAYVADQAAHELSVRIADVHRQFAALYAVLGVAERSDVQAAQAALDELRTILQSKSAFERDVVSTLASGSRQQIVGLATRWWKGEEQAIAVKKLVDDYRQKLDAEPAAPR